MEIESIKQNFDAFVMNEELAFSFLENIRRLCTSIINIEVIGGDSHAAGSLVKIFMSHNSLRFHLSVLRLLKKLCRFGVNRNTESEKNVIALGELGCCRLLYNIAEQHGRSSEVFAARSLAAIGCLASTKENKSELVKLGAPLLVVELLKMFPDDIFVCRWAMFSFGSFVLCEGSREQLDAAGMVDHILRTLMHVAERDSIVAQWTFCAIGNNCNLLKKHLNGQFSAIYEKMFELLKVFGSSDRVVTSWAMTALRNFSVVDRSGGLAKKEYCSLIWELQQVHYGKEVTSDDLIFRRVDIKTGVNLSFNEELIDESLSFVANLIGNAAAKLQRIDICDLFSCREIGSQIASKLPIIKAVETRSNALACIANTSDSLEVVQQYIACGVPRYVVEYLHAHGADSDRVALSGGIAVANLVKQHIEAADIFGQLDIFPILCQLLRRYRPETGSEHAIRALPPESSPLSAIFLALSRLMAQYPENRRRFMDCQESRTLLLSILDVYYKSPSIVNNCLLCIGALCEHREYCGIIISGGPLPHPPAATPFAEPEGATALATTQPDSQSQAQQLQQQHASHPQRDALSVFEIIKKILGFHSQQFIAAAAAHCIAQLINHDRENMNNFDLSTCRILVQQLERGRWLNAPEVESVLAVLSHFIRHNDDFKRHCKETNLDEILERVLRNFLAHDEVLSAGTGIRAQLSYQLLGSSAENAQREMQRNDRTAMRRARLEELEARAALSRHDPNAMLNDLFD